nr:EOG090X09ZU [Eulimnadia texana]
MEEQRTKKETEVLIEENQNETPSKSKQTPPEMNPDFLVIRIVARIVLSILRQCWAASSALFLTIVFLYWIYGGFTAFLLLCFSAAGLIYRAGDKLLYYPDTPTNARVYIPAPNVFGLAYESIYLKSLDGTKIHAFFVKHQQVSNRPTVLFLHGNAGNIGHRLPNAKGLYRHLNANVFLLEYRGYGLSEGTPSETGLYQDAQAALDYLYNREDVDHSRIIIFGRSLGGAVAVDLASKPQNCNKISCLLLENTFSSIIDMANEIVPWKGIQYLPKWFHKNKFLSKEKMHLIQVPVVFISGTSDQLVPPSMMMELYSKCSSQRKILLQIPGGDHNGTWTKPSYYPNLSRCLSDVCSNRPLPQMTEDLNVQRLKQVGCFVTTGESVIYKLIGDKENPQFNELRPLLKNPTKETGLVAKM